MQERRANTIFGRTSIDAMPDTLPSLIAADKTMATMPEWIGTEDQFTFVVGLDIDRVTQIGLRLRGRCARAYPDENVSFQIEYQFRGISRFVPVARIDWRPLKPHTNRNIGPPALRLLRFHGTHLHPFHENHDWMMMNGRPLAESLKAYDLPIATPITPEPADLTTLMTLAGRSFTILGMEQIPAPPWPLPRLI